MARSKKTVKKRSKLHRTRVASGIKMRARRKARSPASVKRKKRALRRANRAK